MRLRTFIMKDAYSFDVDQADWINHLSISAKLTNGSSLVAGFKFSIVEASSGSMGGSESNEFVARTRPEKT